MLSGREREREGWSGAVERATPLWLVQLTNNTRRPVYRRLTHHALAHHLTTYRIKFAVVPSFEKLGYPESSYFCY